MTLETTDDAPRRYRELVERSLGVICSHDLEGYLLEVNPAGARIFERDPQEMVGRNLREFLAPPVRHLLDDYLRDFPARKTHSGLMRIVTQAGEERVLQFQNALSEEADRPPYVIASAVDVTDLLRARAALREREARLRLLMQQMPAVLWSTDRDLRFTVSQGGGLAGLDLLPDQVAGLTLAEYFGRDDPDFVPLAAHRRALSGESTSYEFEWKERAFHSHVEPLRDDHGAIVGTIGVARDITERKKAENATRSALSILEATLESTADGILVVDTAGRITSFNRKFAEMWGIPDEILRLGKDERAVTSVLHQLRDPDRFLAGLRELRDHPDADSHDVIEFRDGRIFERYSQAQRIGGRIVGRVWSFSDVTERQRTREKIEYQAFHDALTGLPNRLLVQDRLHTALAAAKRHGRLVAVMFLDLDHFKLVNDSFGHGVGDELLQAVAERLGRGIRGGDTLGRLGGDEFTIVLPDIERTADAVNVAQKILSTIAEPFVLDGSRIDISTSIGISLFPDDGDEVQALLRSADTAMYRAKELGRNTFQLSTPEMNQRMAERLELVKRLSRALRDDELELHFQPIVQTEGGRIVAVEALCRWRHSDGHLLPPADFIPAAEESHLIVSLSEWVLRTACSAATGWQQRSPGLRVAVNLSLRQFRQEDLAQTVARILAETGLDPERLELEITETTAMHNVERTISTLHTLRDQGVRISLDDFGSGQTSLSHLRRLPLTAIKIDRAFVTELASSDEAAAIMTALLTMARTLSLEITAEGVETAAQLAFLRRTGCDTVQGFLVGRPVPAEAVAALLVGNS